MDTTHIILLLAAIVVVVILIIRNRAPKEQVVGYIDRRTSDEKYRKNGRSGVRSSGNSRPKFNPDAIAWCASFLDVDRGVLSRTLKNIPDCYKLFSLRKRSGGFRIISAPRKQLRDIQQTLYRKALFPVHPHPAATGFRAGMSVKDNAGVHLGRKYVLKTDIHDFFGSIGLSKVRKTFESIGYPYHTAKVMAHICCLKRRLPQGAPTSPALSNLVVKEMDEKMARFAQSRGIRYSRYADDMVFSSDEMNFKEVLASVDRIVREEGFRLNRKKTRLLGEKKRKIITGVSISSGTKLTIPKTQKREIRQNVYYVLKYGVKEHQRRIGSKDPVYLKRLAGQLGFWLSVEPENAYARRSLKALGKLKA